MFEIFTLIYIAIAVAGGVLMQRLRRRTGLWWGLGFLALIIPIFSIWAIIIPEVRGSTGEMRQALLRWVDVIERIDGVSRRDALDSTATIIRVMMSDLTLLVIVTIAMGVTPTAPMRDARRRTPCPHCAEMILPAAKICPHCRQPLAEGWTAPKMPPVELPPKLQGESEADYQARIGRLGYRVLSSDSGHA